MTSDLPTIVRLILASICASVLTATAAVASPSDRAFSAMSRFCLPVMPAGTVTFDEAEAHGLQIVLIDRADTQVLLGSGFGVVMQDKAAIRGCAIYIAGDIDDMPWWRAVPPRTMRLGRHLFIEDAQAPQGLSGWQYRLFAGTALRLRVDEERAIGPDLLGPAGPRISLVINELGDVQ